MNSIRKQIRKILSQTILEASKLVNNKRVEWNSFIKEGKVEGLTKGQIIYAIGSEKFCKAVQKLMEKKQLKKGSESYSYMVAHSKVAHSKLKPGAFVLVENWEGFYD